MNPRTYYLITTLLLFLLEVFIATALKHYTFIRANFGDFLVVILIYCFMKIWYPFEAKKLALGVFIFAVMIEISQYFHLANILHLHGIGRIILGTNFSFQDIAMYALGCWVAYWGDKKFISIFLRGAQ